MQNPYLVCTHIVEGHSEPVLCVDCTDDVLFTGSQGTLFIPKFLFLLFYLLFLFGYYLIRILYNLKISLILNESY